MQEWFDNLSINKILYKNDANLYSSWISMQEQFKAILDAKNWYEPIAYTPHDYSHHFKGVLINASSLIETYIDFFSAEEIYCFLVACLLHDIDMAYNPYGRSLHSLNSADVLSHYVGKRVDDCIISSSLYNIEHELSTIAVSPEKLECNKVILDIHQRLESFLTFQIPSEKYRQAIAWIIIGHSDLKLSNNHNIDTLNEELYSQVNLWKDNRSERMHLAELGAFLRWADELDCSSERISGIINKPSNEEAAPYWDKLEVVENIHIAPGVITIYPCDRLLKCNLEYYLPLICELEKKLYKEYNLVQKAINRSQKIVFGQQIRVLFSETNLESRYRKVKEDLENKPNSTPPPPSLDAYINAIAKYHDRNDYVRFIRDIRNDIIDNPIETKLKKSSADSEDLLLFSDVIMELEDSRGEDFVTIFGDGGAGKTYMLVNGMDMLKKNIKYDRHILYIPLNKLKFSLDGQDGQQTEENAIVNYITQNVFKIGSLPDWKEFYNDADGRKLLLLLDGFNEVPDKSERRSSLIYEIGELHRDLNCKVVLSSRPEDLIMSNLSNSGMNFYMAELTDDDIAEYIDRVHAYSTKEIKRSEMIVSGYNGLKGSTVRDFSTPRAKILKLCKLPLLLSLYGQTYMYQRNNDAYALGKKACNWIDYNENDPEPSYILWNYFNREFLRTNENSGVAGRINQIVALLAVHVFCPRVAFWMQINNRFNIEPEDLISNISESLDWLIDNITTHTRLAYIRNAVIKISNVGTQYLQFLETHLNVNSIVTYISDEQIFFGGRANELNEVSSDYSFRHQSIRDCFAAMHLLNTAVIKDSSHPESLISGWDLPGIFNNTYMRDHLLSLAKIHKYSTLVDAVESLRGVYLPLGNYYMENLLIAIRKSGIYGADGSLVDFDFKKLDLELCDLIEVKLVRDDGKAANINEALRMGDNVLIKPAHNDKPVRNIAISKNGRNVVSCGDDAVLLWDFKSRKVVWRIFEYKQSVNNRCCFADDDQRVIFTNGKELHVWDIEKRKDIIMFTANVDIDSVASFTDHSNNDRIYTYFIARDKAGSNYCWCSDNKVLIQVDSSADVWIHYTPFTNQLLRYNYTTKQLDTINWAGNDCCVSFGAFNSVPQNIAFAVNAGLCAFVYTSNENDVEVRIIDMIGNRKGIDLFNRKSETSSQFITKVNTLAFAQSGRWLSVWGSIGDSIVKIYQQKDNSLCYFELTQSYSFDYAVVPTSPCLYESFIFYGNKKGKIIVDEISKDDPNYYKYTSLDNHPPYVQDVSVIPNIDRCVVAYEDGTVREWNYLTQELIRKYAGYHDGSIDCVASANTKSLIASGGVDGKVLIWDRGESYARAKEIGNVAQLLHKETWEVDKQRVKCISFTDDDKYIITSDNTGIVRVWPVQEKSGSDEGCNLLVNNPLIQFNENYNNVNHNSWSRFLLYSLNGQKRIVITDIEGALFFGRLVFDENGLLIKIVKIEYFPAKVAHDDRIRSLAFSPNSPFGICVATYGHDKKIKIWVEKAGKIEVLKVYDAYFRAEGLSFSPDGNKLYYSSNNDNKNSVMVLDLSVIEPREKKIHDEHAAGYFMRVKTTEEKVISWARDGFITVSNYDGDDKKKLTIKRNLASHFKHTFDNYKKEQRRQFIVETKSPIQGLFTEWWCTGQLINIFKLVNPKYDNSLSNDILEEIFGIDFLECTDVDARINMFVRSVIPDQLADGMENTNADVECGLLEVIISYLYYEAEADEKNMAMVSILLESCDLYDLITTIWVKNARGKTAILIDDYIQLREFAKKEKEEDNWPEDTWNDSDIVKPILLPMFQFAFLPSQNVAPTDPLIYDINAIMCFSDTIVLPNPNWYGSKDDIVKAQILFLSLLHKFIDFIELNDTKNKTKELIRFLDSSIEESLAMFYNLCENDNYKQYKNLIDDFERTVATSSYTALASANRVIADFYREI